MVSESLSEEIHHHETTTSCSTSFRCSRQPPPRCLRLNVVLNKDEQRSRLLSFQGSSLLYTQIGSAKFSSGFSFNIFIFPFKNECLICKSRRTLKYLITFYISLSRSILDTHLLNRYFMSGDKIVSIVSLAMFLSFFDGKF